MEYKVRIDFTESRNNDGDLEGVIKVIGFTYMAMEGDQIVSAVSGEINAPSPDPNNFTPLDDVTLPQLEGWVLSIIDENKFKRKIEWQITNG